MHWPDPDQRCHIEEIRDNLIARIAEAEREGWLGEVEGLRTGLAGANDKFAQVDALAKRTVDRRPARHAGLRPVRRNRRGEEIDAVTEISGERRSKRNRKSGLTQLGQSGGHALLHSSPISTHAMLQGTPTGGERPRWRIVSHPVGVHPDQGVHALLAQPFQDE
jgi:hypothetical protein